MEKILKLLLFAGICVIIVSVKKTAEISFGERIKSMSKGKTAICICAMVASCVTGSVFVADSAMSGHTIGKMNNQEAFSFDNQQLSNTMPTFTAPIGETTKETIKADNYIQTTTPVASTEYVAKTCKHKTKTTTSYTETNITNTAFTEQAITTTVTSDSPDEAITEVVTTSISMAVTTCTTTTCSSQETVATTTTVVTVPETTAETEFSVPTEWFVMETQSVQIMETEPVVTEPVCLTTTMVYTEPVTETTTESTTTTTICTEPITETTTTELVTEITAEPVTTTTTTIYTEPVITTTICTEPEITYSSASYISDSEYILLCNAVAHEAGSDWIDIYSKANVVEVIMNRVNSPLFPNTIYEVLSQPYQFEGSETYTNLGTYSYQVTDSVKSAVDLYFSDPYSFSHGYLFFYGDGYQNHFSVSQ